MNDGNETEDDPKTATDGGGVKRFLVSFFADIAKDLFRLVIAFAVGTGASAVVCWYYGIPLAFSILGGILVLGLALALTSDSLFS